MTDVLDRTPVSGDYDLAKLGEFADALGDVTPVTRPRSRSVPFDVLVSVSREAPLTWSFVLRGLRGAPLVSTSPGSGRTTPAVRPAQGGKPVVHPGTQALDDLQRWLNLSKDDVVRLVGLSASTHAWWRKHPDAPVRAKKAGRLLRLRTAVGVIVGTQGLNAAREFLHSGGWMAAPLDESSLVALEASVQRYLAPNLEPPTKLLGGLSKEQLAELVGDVHDELAQQRAERSKASWGLGPDDSGSE